MTEPVPFPNETNPLDQWLGPRPVSQPGALGRLTSNDPRDPDKPLLEKAAELIGHLWGVPYTEAGKRLRKDMQGAARWVLVDQNGDLDAMEGAYTAMIADKFTKDACAKCQSPYAVARKMYAFAAKQAAEKRKAKVDYTDYVAPVVVQETPEDLERAAKWAASWGSDV